MADSQIGVGNMTLWATLCLQIKCDLSNFSHQNRLTMGLLISELSLIVMVAPWELYSDRQNHWYFRNVLWQGIFYHIKWWGTSPLICPTSPYTQFSCPAIVLPFWERTVDLLWVNNWMNWYHNKFAFRIISIISSLSSSHFVIFML